MGLFNWLSKRKTAQEVAPATAVEPTYGIPTVNLDPKRATAAVKADLAKSIKRIKEFDAIHLDKIYDAALRSIF